MGVDVNPNILMAFLFDGSPHDGADDLLNSTDEADTMQRRFHLALQGSGKIVSNYEAEPFYKQFSGVTNGMFVRFQLQIKSSKVFNLTINCSHRERNLKLGRLYDEHSPSASLIT
jgi:hypothetical protein